MTNLPSVSVGRRRALIGAALGAVAVGVASAATNGAIGFDIALQRIPRWTQGYSVVSAVRDAFAGGAVGGGIGALVVAAAKGSAARV